MVSFYMKSQEVSYCHIFISNTLNVGIFHQQYYKIISKEIIDI